MRIAVTGATGNVGTSVVVRAFAGGRSGHANRMSARQVVGMHMPHRSERAERAHAELTLALPDADVGEPDETGTFEIALDAVDQEAALQRVWNALALAGADEHIVFIEHADVPEHWRARAGGG